MREECCKVKCILYGVMCPTLLRVVCAIIRMKLAWKGGARGLSVSWISWMTRAEQRALLWLYVNGMSIARLCT